MAGTGPFVPPPTEQRDIDRALDKLKAASGPFSRLALRERIKLLQEMRRATAAIAQEWVEKACEAKGLSPSDPLAGEEWLAGPFITIRNFRLLEKALREVETHGQPEIADSALRTRPNGGLAVKVFPASGQDSALFAGLEAEVFLEPGVSAAQMRERQARFYKRPDHQGLVSLILGAGNVASIPPTDVVSKLFVEGKVCVLKMNPVNAYLGPLFEKAFQDVIQKGYFGVVYGGAEVGAYLVNHANVDEVHITGSDKTHDLMVWGPPGPDRDARIARNEPLLKKEITSELGNVSPVIFVPGPYSSKELAFQAANLAGAVTNNGSFNCNAAKLLVQPKGWAKRNQLVDLIGGQLAEAPVRKAYYPGAKQRWESFVEGRSNVKQFGRAQEGELPWTLILDVDAEKKDEKIFRDEPFCAVLSETAVGSDDPVTYLREAVKFVNDRVWGTLNCTVVIHPKTLEDPAAKAAFDQALEDLRYGAVGVNLWPATVFALGSTPWGGYPGAPLHDIQSGRGFVHNTYLLEDIQKTVAIQPVTAFPKPLWFPGHKTAHEVGRKLVDFEANDASWFKVPGIAMSALGG